MPSRTSVRRCMASPAASLRTRSNSSTCSCCNCSSAAAAFSAADTSAEAPSGQAPEAAEPEEEADEQADTLSFDEPWIDTPLCTSCNDCLKVNAVVFLYNEEKQAYLGDLSKVSYVELVTAAELCPARCIHPGLPLNPNEPGLDELIERAAPFNQ